MKYNFFCIISLLLVIVINSNAYGQDSKVTIEREINSSETDHSITLNYTKRIPGNFYIYLDFSNVTNCDVTNYKTVVKGFSGRLLTLKPSDDKKGIGYSLRYYTIVGEPNPKVDSLFHYVLPFKKGKVHKIAEAGYLGEKYFDQERPKNWKSYVINSKTADTICCMRKGIVVKIENQFENSTLNMVYTSKRNSITVEHSDGTLATYKGFKNNGIFVKLGQTVFPQTELGILEQFNSNNYRADISISFLFDENFNMIEKQTMQNYKSKFEFVTPYFVTSNGIEKLVSNKEYTSVCSEKEFLEEFTRSEKKKYLKDPTQFN